MQLDINSVFEFNYDQLNVSVFCDKNFKESRMKG